MLKYQAIILNNVTLEETPSNFISSLKTYVEDFGGGLFVAGGAKSYALGGYYKTELEEMLPLNMEMKRDGMLPSVSMLVIIDRSGSTDGNKIEMAKEAARKSVEAMKPNDSRGVLAFDDTRAWVSRLTRTEDEDAIINAIGTINSGGEHQYFQHLEMEFLSLKHHSQSSNILYFSQMVRLKQQGMIV